MTRIVFISNYLSHHQKPFCDRMAALLGDSFTFVATIPFEQDRLSMGWKQEEARYVLPAYQADAERNKTERLINEADVAILGSAPDSYIVPRLKASKVTFKYAERFYKQGIGIKNFVRAAGGTWLHHGRFQKYPIYLLCASAYTAADAAIFGNYVGRAYQWGYFPFVKSHNPDELMLRKRSAQQTESRTSCVSILWVGRLIGWKHPEAAIHLATKLKAKGYRFRLSIIGSGEMEEDLRKMIRERNLGNDVSMLGSMPPENVRIHMEEADIFLFTSDFNEGWGAVLNESMNSGCAVVASHAIGAVPFLIRDGENGLIYKSGDQTQLEQSVQRLMDDEQFRRKLGKRAYLTMIEEWNADIAAERVLQLSQALMERKDASTLFSQGPCSIAPILKNNWYT